jgi:predicted dehydrogenase
VSAAAPLPIGVIGVGSLGFHHARILREVQGAELVGIHDVDPGRAATVAEQLGVPAFGSLEELLGQVRAAVVAVPTTAHESVGLAAIDRGVDVLIEKPIAASLEEADALLERAGAAGVRVAIGHVERFNAALRASEPYLEAPRFIESHRLAPFNPRGTDVAVVLDLMIHDIDLVLGLIGGPVESVDAVGVPVLTPSVDIANARLRFASGAVANITASRVSRERMRKLRIFQPSGYLSVDLGTGSGEFLRLREGALPGALADPAARLETLVERVEIQGDGAEPLRAELESFVGAIRDETPLVVTGEDGRRALRVALEIVRSTEDALARSPVDVRPAGAGARG